jgi:pyridoxal phosphate enzyme (YggS family)
VGELIRGLRVEHVRENLERVRSEISAAGRNPDEVEVLAAVKYLAVDELEVLAQAGIGVLGENRAQDLAAKADAYPNRFKWDFIGQLQSRKVRQLTPYVRYIHSVATDSALTALERHGTEQTEVMVEVNVAGEESKAGIPPDQLEAFLDRSRVPVVGLMTMPPAAENPEASRPHFGALRELAAQHGLRHLSMGTSQDYVVAVQEGATIVRLGTILYSDPASRAS